MEKAAADYVKRSLASLSSAAPKISKSKNIPDPEEKVEDNEKILFDINVDWEEIARLSDVLVSNNPNKPA